MKTIFSFIMLILIYGCSSNKKNEKYYQTIFCEELNGKMEYILKDKSRIDCLTDKYAIEVDWARKLQKSLTSEHRITLHSNTLALNT